MRPFLLLFPMTVDTTNAELIQEAEKSLANKDYQRTHELCLSILAAEPTFARAYFLLALIAVEHENYHKALDVLDRAIRFDAQQAEFFAHRARCFLALNRQQDARLALESASQQLIYSAHTADTIGVTYTRLGDHARAVDFFKQAVAKQPENASFMYNLGTALQFAGDFINAGECYEKAIILEPTLVKAHSALSQLRKQSSDNNHIERLEKLWHSDLTHDADNCLNLGHALAKEYEDLGDTKRSFQYLVAAKRLKRQKISPTSTVDQSLFDAARSGFAAMQSQEIEGFITGEPIFIVGMPRTGTTLVDRILSSHSCISSAGELTHFALALKRLTGTPSPYVLDAETLNQSSQVNFTQLGKQYLDSTRPLTGQSLHFTDKMPLNFFYVGLIAAALPQAKIIIVIRNPLDTCLSNYRQLFSTRFPYYNYAYDLRDTANYYVQFFQLMEFWQSVLPNNVHVLHYEKLVADTETEVKRLVAHCGLQFEHTCLEFHKNESAVSTASSVQVRSPIYSSSIKRWQKYQLELQPIIELFQSHNIVLDDERH